MPSSVRLSLTGIHQARLAFDCLGNTQDDFADKLQVSRGTVSNFLNGKPIYRKNFYNFCDALNLEVKAVMFKTLPQPLGGLPVQLNQWLKNNFEEDWLDVNHLIAINPEYSIRFIPTDACRGRIIVLDEFSLSLLIFLKRLEIDKLHLKIQVHPYQTEYLPSNLELVLLSKEQVIKEVISKENTNFIQAVLLELLDGEEFTLKIIHQDFSFSKSFIF